MFILARIYFISKFTLIKSTSNTKNCNICFRTISLIQPLNCALSGLSCLAGRAACITKTHVLVLKSHQWTLGVLLRPEYKIQTLTTRRPAERSPPSPGSYTLQWFMNICVFDTNQDPWTKFFFYSSSNPQPFSFYSSRLCWRSLYKNKQKIQPSLRDLHQPITLQFHQPTLQTKKHQKIGETRIYWYILNIDLTNKI